MKERTLDGFGTTLAELRQRRGLTQAKLGAAVGDSRGDAMSRRTGNTKRILTFKTDCPNNGGICVDDRKPYSFAVRRPD